MTLRVLFVAAEATPFSKVGGLADVAGSLPSALAARGHDVRLVTPAHTSTGLEAATSELSIDFRGSESSFRVQEVEMANAARAWVVNDSTYFGRTAVYGEADDLDRYLFFCQTALELPRLLNWPVDVIHLNDWHTGATAYGLRNYAWSDEFYRRACSVFTIHNLRYRGPDSFVDLIGPAIFYSDIVTTVSPKYASEILTPELGEGLHELLATRRDNLFGVVNGIDYAEFDPATDPRIEANFDLTNLEPRAINRSALRRRLGLEESESRPIVAMITRLSEQKGIDIALESLKHALASDRVQVVILGAGDASYERAAAALPDDNPRQASITIGFDAGLAQQIYAGSDIFLMPSRFEPCGLGQMIAMRYGSIPVVRRTGGLADTVPDSSEPNGLGFVFQEYSADALTAALNRALDLYADADSWRSLQIRAMRADFSWGQSAAAYEGLYEKGLAAKRR